jgi:hypothetical protein
MAEEADLDKRFEELHREFEAALSSLKGEVADSCWP